jgi:hypothetical protein
MECQGERERDLYIEGERERERAIKRRKKKHLNKIALTVSIDLKKPFSVFVRSP